MIHFYPFQRNQAQQKVDDKMCEAAKKEECQNEEGEEEEEMRRKLLREASQI